MVFVLALEMVLLKKLETSDDEAIRKALRMQSNPMFFVISFLWAIGMIFLIPKLFGFELSFTGFYVGMAIYLGNAHRVSKPKWQAHKDRLITNRMHASGQKGTRVAGLSVRKLGDYIPLWTLVLPYLLLAAVPFYLLIRFGLPGFLAMADLSMGFLCLLGIFMTAVLTKRMFDMVQEPVDLRSDALAQFLERINSFLRGRLRILLLFQMTYCISTVTLMLGWVVEGAGQYRSLLNPMWIIAGAIPFSACGAWLSISSARAMAKLEEERWATAV